MVLSLARPDAIEPFEASGSPVLALMGVESQIVGVEAPSVQPPASTVQLHSVVMSLLFPMRTLKGLTPTLLFLAHLHPWQPLQSSEWAHIVINQTSW